MDRTLIYRPLIYRIEPNRTSNVSTKSIQDHYFAVTTFNDRSGARSHIIANVTLTRNEVLQYFQSYNNENTVVALNPGSSFFIMMNETKQAAMSLYDAVLSRSRQYVITLREQGLWECDIFMLSDDELVDLVNDPNIIKDSS